MLILHIKMSNLFHIAGCGQFKRRKQKEGLGSLYICHYENRWLRGVETWTLHTAFKLTVKCSTVKGVKGDKVKGANT